MFKLLKHPASSDIAMEVIKKFYVEEKDVYKLRVKWWNIGRCHAPFCMNVTQKLTLPAAKFREWKYMEYGKVKDEQNE